MNTNTPFFPAWRSKLAALGRRARAYRCAAEVENEFSRFLPSTLLTPADRGVGSRRRIFTRMRTFWCFLWQVLQPRTACRAVVRKIQAEGETARRTIDESSSAYCQARARLPLPLLQKALEHSAQGADRMALEGVPGWSRPIKVVDATSFQTPDTPANRKQYRYPTGQKKGCGFPVAHALALFSLASGAILNVVTAACYTAELVMFKTLWPVLQSGDILLGDRVFGCFALLAAMPLQGVDVVARLHQGRNLDLRRADKLGPEDWQITLHRPPIRPAYFKRSDWKRLPKTLRVRIIRSRLQIKGFRTRMIWIVTTLLDAKKYTRGAITDLYWRRWQMELSFRDLKTTMGMESLRCRTPEMIEKELLTFLIAHNFLRALMAEAATLYQVPRQRISFKGAVDSIRSFHPAMLRAASKRALNRLRCRLLAILVADILPLRPGRSEPRAVKKRPKSYPLLTKPRHIFKELPHKGKTRNKRPQVILT
jgi:hypothetical protein